MKFLNRWFTDRMKTNASTEDITVAEHDRIHEIE
jgi:hypothetical protein